MMRLVSDETNCYKRKEAAHSYSTKASRKAYLNFFNNGNSRQSSMQRLKGHYVKRGIKCSYKKALGLVVQKI
jgi:hypothetical protein